MKYATLFLTTSLLTAPLGASHRSSDTTLITAGIGAVACIATGIWYSVRNSSYEKHQSHVNKVDQLIHQIVNNPLTASLRNCLTHSTEAQAYELSRRYGPPADADALTLDLQALTADVQNVSQLTEQLDTCISDCNNLLISSDPWRRLCTSAQTKKAALSGVLNQLNQTLAVTHSHLPVIAAQHTMVHYAPLVESLHGVNPAYADSYIKQSAPLGCAWPYLYCAEKIERGGYALEHALNAIRTSAAQTSVSDQIVGQIHDMNAALSSALNTLKLRPEYRQDTITQDTHKNQQQLIATQQRVARAQEDHARATRELACAERAKTDELRRKNDLQAQDIALRATETIAHNICNRRIAQLERALAYARHPRVSQLIIEIKRQPSRADLIDELDRILSELRATI